MEIRFKRSGAEDLDEILSLINTLNRDIWSNIIPEEYYKEPFLTREQIDKMATYMEFYVYRVENEIVAAGSFSSRDKQTAWIPVMYVRADFQRKGIGSSMIEFLEKIARERKYSKIHLETDSKAFWAVNFYEKHGYTILEKEKIPWGYHIWMSKTL